RPSVRDLEARGRVGDAAADEQRHRPGEDADRLPAGPRRPVALAADEPRADRDVGVPGEDRPGEDVELTWVVLTVAVDAKREVEALLMCVPVAGLDGAADAEVEGQPE